jgi:PAS domain S-box-containing protein
MTEIIERLKELNDKLTDRLVIEPAMFEQIVDSLPDGLVVIDEGGLIQLCNKQIELLFGYPRAALIGEPIHMLLPEALREKHAGHIARYFSNPSVRPMREAQTLAGRHRSGRTIHVQIILGPVISSQGVLALAVVRRQVSDGARE